MTMKKMMVAASVALASITLSFGAGSASADVSALKWSKRCGMTVEEWQALSKEQQKAKKDEFSAKVQADTAQQSALKWAKRCDMTPEEWAKLSKEEQKAKKDAYKSGHADKWAPTWAERYQMTVEQWKALPEDEKKAKQDAWVNRKGKKK